MTVSVLIESRAFCSGTVRGSAQAEGGRGVLADPDGGGSWWLKSISMMVIVRRWSARDSPTRCGMAVVAGVGSDRADAGHRHRPPVVTSPVHRRGLAMSTGIWRSVLVWYSA
jgi:hypothetical protein